MKIIKILLLLFFVCIVFLSVRFASTEQGLIASLDHWLGQFQTDNEGTEEDDDDSDEEEGEEDDDDVPSRVVDYKGLPAVRLSDDVIARSGIQLGFLEASNLHGEPKSIAQVVSIEALNLSRAEYLQADGELKLVEEGLRASARVYERLRVLHKERANVSLRQVEEARSHMNADKTRVAVAKQAMANIRQQMKLGWGDTLTNAALALAEEDDSTKNGADQYKRLSAMEDVLLVLTLPSDVSSVNNIGKLYISSQSDRSSAVVAKYVSAALQGTSLSQGLTYFYQAPAENFRAGMKLHAWLELDGKVGLKSGFNVPESAVIWFAGQTWVYAQVDDELYARHPIKTDQSTDVGWFINDASLNGKKVAVKGPQLLLSEELRWQIPDEDDD